MRLELADFGHEFIGHLLVDLFEPLFGAVLCLGAERAKQHGPTIFHRYPARPGQEHVPIKGLKCSEDADGNHRGGGFDHREADA